MKNHKLTPQVLKLIDELSKILPPDYIKNHDGSVKFRKMAKRVLGKDLPNNIDKPADFHVDKIYIHRYSEPVTIDHAVKLRGEYSAKGEKGLNDYIDKYKIKTEDSELNTTKDA